MRIVGAALGLVRSAFCVPLLFISMATSQNPPSSHVVIPNPTPRPADLKQQYGDDSKDGKKQKELSIQNQLRAREVWLESNQMLLLAQQLQQEVSGKKSMAADAVKVRQIEKLARSVQEQQTASQSISSSADRGRESAEIMSSDQVRQAEIQTNTKRLYELCAQLRAEVGRTYKESLSLNVLRKAEEVEKLARNLKAEMNQEAATAKRKN